MLRDPAVLVLLLACACAWAGARVLRGKRADPFPKNLPVVDPPRSDEGTFVIGRYLPDAGESCVWAPWDGGEQHLGIFGTTGSGKTVAARLLAVTAAERWGWDVVAIDGAKGGIDFTFLADSGLGTVVAGEAIPDMLDAVADAIETRAHRLAEVRVKRTDPRTGREYAVAPGSIRELDKGERMRNGLQPQLVIIDELAILLASEKGQKVKKITPPLLRIAAAGRFAGIHLVCIMQRGDSDLLDGFIGNLLRARCLVGTTDQVAEGMAHGASSMAVWRELMAAEGYEPDGMERALRPPGRAFVSGLSARAPGLVQLYRFDATSRALSWDEWERRSSPEPESPDPVPPSPDSPTPPDSPRPRPGTVLTVLTPESPACYAGAGRASGPDPQPLHTERPAPSLAVLPGGRQ